MSDAEVSARLGYIEQHFQDEKLPASLWWGGWLAYSVAEGVVGAVYYARSHDRLNRDLWLLTWIGAAVSVGELLIFPMIPAYASHRMRGYPRNTPEERCAALERSVDLLHRSSDLEIEGTNLWAHLLGAAWTVGTIGYLIGRNYDFDQPASSHHNRVTLLESGIDLIWTVAVIEGAIWSQPRKSIHAWSEYQKLSCREGHCRTARGPRVSPTFALGPTSLSFGLRF
jgi:hypothetical protein